MQQQTIILYFFLNQKNYSGYIYLWLQMIALTTLPTNPPKVGLSKETTITERKPQMSPPQI